MAVLWEQKNLVRELEELSSKHEKSVSDTRMVNDALRSEYGYWVLENLLIEHLIQKENKKLEPRLITKWKKVLQSCIDRGLVSARPNNNFEEPENNPGAEDPEKLPPERSSRRWVQVSCDKGPEVLNVWYFWFKHMTDEFPSLTNIGVTVITAILTSGAIWLFLLKVLGVSIGGG